MAKTTPKPRKLAPLPRLRPGVTTAYAVLQHVQRIIREEPKRLDMGYWVSEWRSPSSTYDRITAHGRLRRSPLAACGTAACVGGWINIVTRHTVDGSTFATGSEAISKLFDPWDPKAVDARDDLDRIFMLTRLPTRSILKRLREYCLKHEAVLRAQRVEVYR